MVLIFFSFFLISIGVKQDQVVSYLIENPNTDFAVIFGLKSALLNLPILAPFDGF